MPWRRGWCVSLSMCVSASSGARGGFCGHRRRAWTGLRMEGPEPPDDTLVRAIQALPPKYREVIILYYYQEWRAWEIAQRLHVPVSTVTVRLSRARGLLRERLKGWYYEQE